MAKFEGTQIEVIDRGTDRGNNGLLSSTRSRAYSRRLPMLPSTVNTALFVHRFHYIYVTSGHFTIAYRPTTIDLYPCCRPWLCAHALGMLLVRPVVRRTGTQTYSSTTRNCDPGQGILSIPLPLYRCHLASQLTTPVEWVCLADAHALFIQSNMACWCRYNWTLHGNQLAGRRL